MRVYVIIVRKQPIVYWLVDLKKKKRKSKNIKKKPSKYRFICTGWDVGELFTQIFYLSNIYEWLTNYEWFYWTLEQGVVSVKYPHTCSKSINWFFATEKIKEKTKLKFGKQTTERCSMSFTHINWLHLLLTCVFESLKRS